MLRRSLVGVVLTLVLGQLSLAGTIGASAANPASAAAGTATLVTFTSVITDTTVIPSTVNLQQIDSAGRATVLGILHDDGLNGDATAGDHIFTVQSTVFQQTPGALTFRVTAGFQGSLLRANSAPITVNITGTGTQITISSPAQSAYLNISPVLVTGTVSDPAATVTVNSVAAQVSGNTFSASIPLQEGSNTITAVANNSGGGTSTDSRLVTLDTTPPHVTISSPAASAMTTASSVNVTGIINDIVVGTVNPQQATVTVNGISAQVANRSYVASNIPLNMGPNTIQATGTDRAGNFATTSVTITRQAPTTPTLTIVSGNNLSGPVKSQLAAPLVVMLTNSSGAPVANTPVVFQVTGGDGTLTTSGPPGMAATAVNTNAQGQAQVFYILGSHAGSGNNLVQASSVGIAATPVFTETATTSPVSMIVIDSGNNQSGVVGRALPLPFIAIVTDAGHNRLGNVPVTFTVKNGGGTIGGQTTYNTTSDSDGRIQAILTLGPQAGINNNLVEANFTGNTGLPATFTATSFVPGPPSSTTISGVVLDNSNVAIPGVTMRLYQVNNGTSGNTPIQIGTPVQTNAQGYFQIAPAPVGVFKLMADGSTGTRGGPYPTLEYDMVTVPGQNNTVGLPIYLPQLSSAGQLCVSPTTGGTLTVPQAPGFALTIAPGSATFPGGARSGCVSVTPVNMDKVPMVPGFGQQPRFIVTIQPVGTLFNPPAQITIPNVDGLAPRAVTEMYSYDHDLASFVAIGTGTVSVDGSVIASDPGVGVLKAGWHCGGDPNSSGSSGSLAVSLSPATQTMKVSQNATVTAMGTPPLDGEYVNWQLVSPDPANPVAQFLNPPSNCPGASSCVATIKGLHPGTVMVKVSFKCDTTGATVDATPVSVTFTTDLKIMQLTYSGAGFQNVSMDSGMAFGTPQWLDNNNDGNATDPGENRFPVSFVRNSSPSLAPKFKLGDTIMAKGVKVHGTGNGLTFDATVDVNGNTIDVPATATTGNLPNAITWMDTGGAGPLTITWQVSFDNGMTQVMAGQSDNPAYITLKPATAMPLYETLLWISSKAANGSAAADNAVATLIWGAFTPRSMTRKDGVTLTYWRMGTAPGVCQLLAGLIVPRPGDPLDGNGSCIAWSQFFEGTLLAQGIAGDTILQIVPDPAKNPSPSGFMVKNWNFGQHIRTGADGIRHSDTAGDDMGVFPKNQGLPNVPCVGPGGANPLASTAAGDDTLVAGMITTGPDGICNTTAAGTDVQLIAVGKGSPNAVAILPGPDGTLQSANAGTDIKQDGIRAGAPDPYIYLIGFDAQDQPGIPGQDNADPPGLFQNHFVVSYNGMIWDPSYGAGPYATQLAHELAAADGIYATLTGGTLVGKKKAAVMELKYF